MKRFTSSLLIICAVFAFASCKKDKVVPVTQNDTQGDLLVGSWKLTQIVGKIDSSATINGVTTTTNMTFGFDSVNNLSVQKVNGLVKYQYPYSLYITLKNDGNNQLIERYTRPNNAGVPTPYLIATNSSWNYTSTNNPYDGVVVRGFDKTTVLGFYKINPATGTGSNYIQNLLTHPLYNSYDVRNGHLYFYVHLQYIGNPDSNSGGSTTNPSVQINADYVITFTRTNTVDYSGL